MTLLLAADTAELYPPGELDAHGWREPGQTPEWSGPANLQLQAGRSDPRAAEGGGHGPHDPARDHVAYLYLPADAPVKDGITAWVRNEYYVLSETRQVTDPLAIGGPLTCWVALATVIARPGGGEVMPDAV